MTKIRKWTALGIVPVLLVLAAFLMTANAFGNAHKVWICHWTEGANLGEEPHYNLIEVAGASWDDERGTGHRAHEEDFEAGGPDDECSNVVPPGV